MPPIENEASFMVLKPKEGVVVDELSAKFCAERSFSDSRIKAIEKVSDFIVTYLYHCPSMATFRDFEHRISCLCGKLRWLRTKLIKKESVENLLTDWLIAVVIDWELCAY